MKVIQQLSAKRVQDLRQHITQNLLPLATAEKAKCAKGRLHLWLQAEPMLPGQNSTRNRNLRELFRAG